MTLAYYIHQLDPFLAEFAPGFGIRWYGLSYLAAFACGWWLYRLLSKKGYANLPENQVGDFIAWWVVLGTILGGRIGYMLFYQFDEFLQNPAQIVRVWEGGMSAHGGMLGLLIATVAYSKIYRISWLNLGDNLVVVAPAGLFFGRCANFINGELFGRITTVPWGVQFPQELFYNPSLGARLTQVAPSLFPPSASTENFVTTIQSSPAAQEIAATILPVRHPSQLYEAFFEGALLLAILWILRTRFRLPNGILMGAFFILYALARSSVEFFREPDAPLIAALTRGQFLSLFLLLGGICVLFYSIKHPQYPLRHPTKK